MNPLEKAVEFIENNGNLFEKARLKYIMHNEPASDQELHPVLLNQRSDGGWLPFWSKEYSSLDATCYKLAQFEQVGVSSHIAIE